MGKYDELEDPEDEDVEGEEELKGSGKKGKKEKSENKKSKKKNRDTEKETDSCFKCLRCAVITFSVLLFLISLGIIVIGIVIIVKEDLILGGFKKSIDEKLKAAQASHLVPKGEDKFEAVSALLQNIAFVVIGIGATFFVLCIFLFGAACCCARNKKCLVCFLVYIIILAIGQIILLVILVEASILQKLINGALSKIIIAQHEKNQFVIYGVQTKFNCCGVWGAKDYFCGAIFDLRCSNGCKKKDAPICPRDSRAALDASSLQICKNKTAFARVASTDYRFAQIGDGGGGGSGESGGSAGQGRARGGEGIGGDGSVGNKSDGVADQEGIREGVSDSGGGAGSKSVESDSPGSGDGRSSRSSENVAGGQPFNEVTAKDPGCGEALWGQLHIGWIVLVALAAFVFLLQLLAAFFACYSLAKRNGREQEKQHSDEINKAKDMSVQTSFMEDKSSQTRRRQSPTLDADSGMTSAGSRRVTPLSETSEASDSDAPRVSFVESHFNVDSDAPPPPPGAVPNILSIPGTADSNDDIEIQTDSGVWRQNIDGSWSLIKMSNIATNSEDDNRKWKRVFRDRR